MPCRQAIWQEKRGEAMEEAVVEAVAAQSESGILTQPSVVVIVLVWLLRSSLVVCGLVLAATAGVWYGVRRPTASVLVPGQSSTLATPLAFCGRLRANWACVQLVHSTILAVLLSAHQLVKQICRHCTLYILLKSNSSIPGGQPLEPVKTNPGVLLVVVVVNFEEQEPAAVPNGADGAGFCPLRADQVPLVPESTRRWPPLSRTARPLDKVKVP
ncbi:hypothetical protein MHUMG1_03107 [Metarhizium humberi]|uniref:Uncharacterized protein n=1 Tax=Metarhizium humberi TaxID=2596975 RepID=A0A9P8MEM4_9HYPO|nr:hypothetical protein MHUMG1_03107 [Metarhizium humberi]